jgi:hypothetical protein
MLKAVAPVLTQDNEEDWPARIAVGLAVKDVMVGWAVGSPEAV